MEKKREKNISRRAFLKYTSLATAALAVTGCKGTMEEFLQSHFKEMTPDEMNRVRQRLEAEYKEKYGKTFHLGTEPAIPGVLFGYGLDLSRCIGCRRCVYACVAENNQSRRPQIQWIRVLRFENGSTNFEDSEHYYDASIMPKEGYYTMPVQCQQCEDPPCVKVCPTGATWKEPDGIVVVDYNWCIGCRYCMAACPFQVPAFQYNKAINPLIMKCDFCFNRTSDGKLPACVGICPVEALTYGPRHEIIKVARNRLKREPDRYVDHIFGEYEVGGTSWLYLTSKEFVELDFPNLGKNPAPGVSESIQHGIFAYFVPPVSLYALLGGIMWITKRRKELDEEGKI